MHCNKVYIISLIITVFTVVFDGYSKIAVKVPKPQELNLNPFTSTLQLIPIAFLDFQGWFLHKSFSCYIFQFFLLLF